MALLYAMQERSGGAAGDVLRLIVFLQALATGPATQRLLSALPAGLRATNDGDFASLINVVRAFETHVPYAARLTPSLGVAACRAIDLDMSFAPLLLRVTRNVARLELALRRLLVSDTAAAARLRVANVNVIFSRVGGWRSVCSALVAAYPEHVFVKCHSRHGPADQVSID